MLFLNMEQLLGFRYLVGTWIINLLGINSLHLLFGDESTLVTIPLFCEAVSAVIADFLVIAALPLFSQIMDDFL